MPQHPKSGQTSLSQTLPQELINQMITITVYQHNKLEFLHQPQSSQQQQQQLYQQYDQYQFSYQNPLKTICGSQFIKLNQLYLNKSIINNIQSLVCLDAPELYLLNLSQNHITNFKPLCKADLRQLQYLITYNNPNVDNEYLKRCLFHSDMVTVVLNEKEQQQTDMYQQQQHQQQQLQQQQQQQVLYNDNDNNNLTQLKHLHADSASTTILAKVSMKSIRKFSNFLLYKQIVSLSDKFNIRQHIVEKLPQYRQRRLYNDGTDNQFQVM